MPIKALAVLLGIVVLALAIRFWNEEDPRPLAQQKATERYEPCLPKIKLQESWIILSDDKKISKAVELIKKAEKNLKIMTQDPALLWEALELALQAKELLNHCKNVSETLKIRSIDLKSSLVEKQESMVRHLEFELARYRSERNEVKCRKCLNTLLRLIPDKKHPYNQRWIKERVR